MENFLCLVPESFQFMVDSFFPEAKFYVDSISAALSCPVFVPPRGRSAGSFPEQRLVIEPKFYETI